jgi:hypothetical protein
MYSVVDVMSTLSFYLIKYYKGCILVKVTCIKKIIHMFNYESHMTKNKLGVKFMSTFLLNVKG